MAMTYRRLSWWAARPRLTGIEAPVEKALGIPVHKPNHPMFVTPLGIALGCQAAAEGDLDA